MTKTIRTLMISAFALVALLALAAFSNVGTAAAHGGRGGGNGSSVVRGPHGAHGLLDRDTAEAVIADALGIAVEELQAAQTAGTRLPDLAAELGVEIETVEDALYTATVAAVNDAVTAGDLTQDEADVILEQLALRQLARQIIDKDVIDAAVADLLGVTVEELDAAHGDRSAMADLLDAAGLTREDIHATIEATKQALVDQAVADGTLTAEQAEQIMAGGPRGQGDHGGRGGRGAGQFNGLRNTPTAPATDTGTDA